MKYFRFLRFAALLPLLVACSTDPAGDVPSAPDPVPTEANHAVPVESALDELHAVLAGIDDPATRAGGGRRVGTIAAVKAAEVLPATRAGEAPDVEDLVYIANFDNGEGYAILGADDRLAPVIAVTETGSLTPEEFAAVARGEYDGSEAPPVFPGVVDYALGLGGGGIGGGGIGGGGIGGGGGNLPFNPGDIDTGGLPPIQTTTRVGAWTTLLKRGPYLPMKWGQNAPYNRYLRNVGTYYKVGCVAVALGQIIAVNYYNVYKNTDPSTIPMQYVGGKKIDWKTIFSEMKKYEEEPFATQRYFDDDYCPTEVVNAIAYFLWGIGLEADMEYGVDGSSSNIDHAHHVLRYMSFQNVTKYYYYGSRAYEMIVDRGLPMYISGRDGNNGHAWVLDGALKQERLIETVTLQQQVIDSRKENRILYHCNFGWSGKCDGYYTENGVLEPRKKPLESELYDRDWESESYYTTDRRVLYYNLW